MQRGSRKLIITLATIISYTAVMVVGIIKGAPVDPFNLGVGMAGLLTPVMYGYVKEYSGNGTGSSN